MTGPGSGDSRDDPGRHTDDIDDRQPNAPVDDRTGPSERLPADEAGHETDQPAEAEPNDAHEEPMDDRSESPDAHEEPMDDRADGRSAPPGVTIEDDGIVRWFLRSNDGTIVVVRDLVVSVSIVAFIGILLFGISGVWPPLVAVESGSMEPNMHRGDMIFVVDDDRFVGDDPVDGTGIVTAEDGEVNGHDTFGDSGDVIIFRPDGQAHQTPIIHRAHYWVEYEENWVETKADPAYTGEMSCDEIDHCPAPHDGFITKGDANRAYDQVADHGAQTTVVKPEWVTGKAKYRIPWLGHVRLTFDRLLSSGPVVPVVPAVGVMLAGGLAVRHRPR